VKWCISAIAWTPVEEPQVADLLVAHGFTGVEQAPSKLFPGTPLDATDGQIRAVRAFWGSRGISLAAMQALLFGHPELSIFASPAARERTQDYLSFIVALAGRLGVPALVFGSPRNRSRGSTPPDQAWKIAVDFFGALGRAAEREGTCLCIEPNPPQYGADFITDSAQALELVRAVNSKGFGLHLDAACALLAGENFPERIAACAPWLRHVHVSEPQLAPVGPGGTADVPAITAALQAAKYEGFVSIEMRGDDSGGNLDRVKTALRHVRPL
jgi:sugar phosphate isomerase/epimerase